MYNLIKLYNNTIANTKFTNISIPFLLIVIISITKSRRNAMCALYTKIPLKNTFVVNSLDNLSLVYQSLPIKLGNKFITWMMMVGMTVSMLINMMIVYIQIKPKKLFFDLWLCVCKYTNWFRGKCISPKGRHAVSLKTEGGLKALCNIGNVQIPLKQPRLQFGFRDSVIISWI